jgi:hypothetical protein
VILSISVSQVARITDVSTIPGLQQCIILKARLLFLKCFRLGMQLSGRGLAWHALRPWVPSPAPHRIKKLHISINLMSFHL